VYSYVGIPEQATVVFWCFVHMCVGVCGCMCVYIYNCICFLRLQLFRASWLYTLVLCTYICVCTNVCLHICEYIYGLLGEVLK